MGKRECMLRDDGGGRLKSAKSTWGRRTGNNATNSREASTSAVEDRAWYYTHVFPLDALAKLLCVGRGNTFQSRELTLFGPSRRVVVRHGHYGGPAGERHLRDLLKNARVARVDFGPVCVQDGAAWAAEDNDLVFDLDLDDYKNALPDSESGTLTAASWAHIAHSARALYALVDVMIDLRAQSAAPMHAYGVFSGRRGVHLVFPRLRRSWATGKRVVALLGAAKSLCESRVASALAVKAEAHGGVAAQFVQEIGKYARATLTRGRLQYMRERRHVTCSDANLLEELLARKDPCDADWCAAGLMMVAPVPDYSVTSDTSHLLKCPFSVHDSTNVVSLPFDLSHALATDLASHLEGACIDNLAQSVHVRRQVAQRVRSASQFVLDFVKNIDT